MATRKIEALLISILFGFAAVLTAGSAQAASIDRIVKGGGDGFSRVSTPSTTSLYARGTKRRQNPQTGDADSGSDRVRTDAYARDTERPARVRHPVSWHVVLIQRLAAGDGPGHAEGERSDHGAVGCVVGNAAAQRADFRHMGYELRHPGSQDDHGPEDEADGHDLADPQLGHRNERQPSAPASSSELQKWEVFTEQVAGRFPQVAEWEVRNEPNHDDFMRGADATVYAKLLAAANRGLSRGNPQSTVIFGGTQFVDVPWIKKALQAGAQGRLRRDGRSPLHGRRRRLTGPAR